MKNNGALSLVPLPPYKHPIGCKWVYETKLRADRIVERYKDRLVAKGYNQIAGIDYIETFAPMAKMDTIRVFLSVAAFRGWYLHQLDVNNSFFNNDPDEEVDMSLPLGFG